MIRCRPPGSMPDGAVGADGVEPGSPRTRAGGIQAGSTTPLRVSGEACELRQIDALTGPHSI